MSRTMQKFGPTSTGPECLGEPVGPETVVPGGARLDASQFPRLDRVLITVTAAAALGAQTITVAALSGLVPAGKTVTLSGGKIATTAYPSAAGATTLKVRPLAQALVGNETGEYSGSGRIAVLTGTAIGRTIAERNAGTGFGPAVNTDTEVYLTARYIEDAGDVDDVTLYRHNKIVYENFLPGVATMDQTLLTMLRGLYTMTLGA